MLCIYLCSEQHCCGAASQLYGSSSVDQSVTPHQLPHKVDGIASNPGTVFYDIVPICLQRVMQQVVIHCFTQPAVSLASQHTQF
jgi:hypothetical protein